MRNDSTQTRTVADVVVSRIAADGVDTVFGLTGGGIMFLIDALARSSDVRFQAMHHEEFAGVAADGYARAGKPYGVAFATTGPGAAHLFSAIAAAWQDSSPTLFVVGQVKRNDASRLQGLSLRQNGTFEFDTTASFAPICKSVEVVTSVESIHEVLEDSLDLCQSGRPGPVVLEIPLDVQGEVVSTEFSVGSKKHSDSIEIARRSDAHSDESGFLGALQCGLGSAHRPLVLLGIGVVRAQLHADYTNLLAKHGIPYVVTQFAREAGNIKHEMFLGSPGIKANRSANIAITECDLLIAIGTSLHQQVTGWSAEAFADLPARKIWCEPDSEVLNARRFMVDDAYEMSAEEAYQQLALALGLDPSTGVTHSDSWVERCAYLRENALLHYPDHAEVSGRLCLYRAVSCLSSYSSSFDAVVTDAGVAWYALAQHFFPSQGSRYLSSGSFGSMGMALPMALGAAHATRGRVLTFTGDGSLMTSVSELATLHESGLPIVLVVNSNDGYLSIRTTHDRYFAGRRIGTDATNGVYIPPIRNLAAAFEIPYRSASSESELALALDDVTSSAWNGPVVIEVFTYVDQAIEPLVESRRGDGGEFLPSTLADMSPFWTDAYEA